MSSNIMPHHQNIFWNQQRFIDFKHGFSGWRWLWTFWPLVGTRFIADQEVAIAAIGPTQNLPDYNWFQRHTYWNRY
jgi:hypothetical protein